jgi:hypothetical protein
MTASFPTVLLLWNLAHFLDIYRHARKVIIVILGERKLIIARSDHLSDARGVWIGAVANINQTRPS